MRHRLKPVLLAIAGMIISVGFLVAGGSQPASAAAPVTLPISSFYQMVVDAANGHIFISQGSSSQNGILVTDLSGAVVTTITGQTAVTGIALSPDGSTLYAATSGAVDAISTATLTQTASFAMPAGDTPAFVAVQSGDVWVSYSTAEIGTAAIGFFDPSAASPSLQSPAALGDWSQAPQIAADPHDTGVLVAVGSGGSGTGLASYDTATNPVTTLAGSPSGRSGCGTEEDLSVAPGGSEFAVACHDAGTVDSVFSTASLSVLRTLGSPLTGEFQVAVSYDGAGDVAAGTTNFIPEPDLFVYAPGATTAKNTVTLYSLSTLGGILAPRGLAWVPDGSQLFGVLSRGSAFALATVPDAAAPQPAPTSTKVSCQSTLLAIGQSTSCTAIVTDTAPGATVPTGAVTFTSDTAGASFTGNGSCTLSPSQSVGVASCAVTYTPGQGSFSQTVTASYGGTSLYAASSGQVVVSVIPPAANTVVTCQPGTDVLGQPTSCTAVVTDTSSSPASPTGTVAFSVLSSLGTFSPGSCTLAPDSSTGQASCAVSYTPGELGSGSHTITATYGGDATHGASIGQVTLTVTPVPTTTVLTCQPGAVLLGQSASCTAVVTDTSSNPASPDGSVTFTSDSGGGFSATSCAVSPDGTTGQSSCTVSYVPDQAGSGTQTVTASYGGDGSHAASSGQAVVTVTARATSTVLTCHKKKSGKRAQKCTAVVSDTSPGTATAPSGTVSFTSSGSGTFSATQCTLSASGTSASCTVTFRPSAGAKNKGQTITASYGGDTTHQASTGSTKLRK